MRKVYQSDYSGSQQHLKSLSKTPPSSYNPCPLLPIVQELTSSVYETFYASQ